MTRINTNVSSLNAQKTLARSNNQLQEALTRLSTGLRINVGKDDPAGLIASEILRSDIVSTQKAISNSERANQMIATADSALGQVSSLLNDVRGLVGEAANKGALSEEQISANQLQIDSSLEAIDRVSQTTQFQGRRLLDGSLSFITQGVDNSKISALSIDKGNFGTLSEIGVSVEVASQAKKAEVTYGSNTIDQDVVLEVGGSQGFEAFKFAAGSSVTDMASAINLVSDALGVQASLADRVATTAQQGEVKIMNVGGANGFKVKAATAGKYAGDFTIRYIKDSALVPDANATWNAGSPNVVDVRLKTSTAGNGVAQAAQSIATNGAAGTLAITAIGAGVSGTATNNIGVTFTDDGSNADGVSSVTYDYTNRRFTVAAGVGTTAATVATALNDKFGSMFTFAAGGGVGVMQAADFKAYNDFTNGAGGDAGAVSADLSDVAQAVAGLTQMTPYVAANNIIGNGASTVDVVNYSGAIGDVNAGGTDDPNNRIILTGKDTAANMNVDFQANGANQTFAIEFTNNTRTNGKSTAYVTATGTAGGMLKVESKNQGTAYDGITVNIVNDATDKSVIYNTNTKTLTVYADVTNEHLGDIADRVNSSLGDAFNATALEPVADGARFADGDSGVTADGAQYDKVTVKMATDANGRVTTTAAEVVNAMNASAGLQALGVTAANVTSSNGSGKAATGSVTLSQIGVTANNAMATGTTTAANGATAQVIVTAKNAGADYNNVKVAFTQDGTAGQEYATYDATQKILMFHTAAGTTSNGLAGVFATGSNTSAAVKALFTVTGSGTGVVTTDDIGYLKGGVTYSGTSLGGVDSEGNFDANQVVGTGGLKLTSTEYGSKQFVSVKALNGTFQVKDTTGAVTDRAMGSDTRARLNGIEGVSDGLNVSLNTSTLSLQFSLTASVAAGQTMNFRITGGGAQFQIGPDVVSQQQTRIGITSMNTAKLGGSAGKLYELRSGGVKSLNGDIIGAAKVVEQVISQVTTLRGRLGAFQRTTLDTNINALNDSLEALTNAESSIRDSDFASESAKLTRAQILVQSGLSVLGIANSRPQSVLSLLRQ